MASPDESVVPATSLPPALSTSPPTSVPPSLLTSSKEDNDDPNGQGVVDLTPEHCLHLADAFFVDEEYQEAVNVYTAGLVLLPGPSSSTDATTATPTETENSNASAATTITTPSPAAKNTGRERDHENEVLRFRILSHRAGALYQLRQYQESYEDCQAIQIPTVRNGEGGGGTFQLHQGETEMYYKRYGMAALALRLYDSAREAFHRAAQLAALNKRSTMVYQDYFQRCVDPYSIETTSTKSTTTSTTGEHTQRTTTSTIGTASATGATRTTTTTPTAQTEVKVVPKYQYYQNDKFMTIAILASRFTDRDLQVRMDTRSIAVHLKLTPTTTTSTGTTLPIVVGKLYEDIIPEDSKVQYKEDKVLIKLKKQRTGYEWNELLAKPEIFKGAATTATNAPAADSSPLSPPSSAPTPTADSPLSLKGSAVGMSSLSQSKDDQTVLPRPYSSNRNWDSIEKSIQQEEESQLPEGDDAMAKLFQQIYANADEDTRRAMVKSYQTSGGTVLSTNWNEVAQKDYEKERSAPKGMEWKTWEGEKLPMKDDD